MNRIDNKETFFNNNEKKSSFFGIEKKEPFLNMVILSGYVDSFVSNGFIEIKKEGMQNNSIRNLVFILKIKSQNKLVDVKVNAWGVNAEEIEKTYKPGTWICFTGNLKVNVLPNSHNTIFEINLKSFNTSE